TNFCIGGFVTLNANTGTGLTYQWQINGVNIAGATSASYFDTVSGNFNVIVTNSSGCSAISNTIAVNKYGETNVCPEPVLGFATINITSTSAKVKWKARTCAQGYTVQYKVMGVPGWTAMQINTNYPSKTLTGLSHSTTYQWKVRTKCDITNGIYSAYSPIQTFTTPLRLEGQVSVNNEEISIYPNPNTGQFSLEFASDVKEENDIIEIYNSLGQSIFKNNISINEGENHKQIDLSKFPSGIYFLNLKTEKEVFRQKIIKE
ncbi:MAG: T9SS type A sorting domain-containing protein, partial [Bacteroidota bacterium]